MPGTTWPRWNWIELAALPVLGALAWSVWAGLPIAALLDFVTDHHASPSSGGAVMLLLLGGTLAGRLTRPLPLPRARWPLLLGGLAAVLVAEWAWLFRPDYAPWDARWLAGLAQQVAHLSAGPILAALLAAGIWRYGLTANWDNHDEFARAFNVGVAALSIGLTGAAAFAPATAGQWVVVAVEFVVVAWAGLSLSGVYDASRTSATGTAPRLNRYWLLAVATVVGLILALGLLLTSWLTPQALAGWAALLQTVGDVTRAVLLAVLYVFSYVVFLVLTPLLAWLQSLWGAQKAPLLQPVNPFANPLAVQPETAVGLPPVLDLIVRAALIIGLLILVGWVLAWAMRRTATTDAAGVRENRELILSWDLLRAQLASLLARQRPPDLFPALGGDPRDPILRLRQAYQRVLAQALARGRPRQPRQTPREYLPALDELWPAEAETLGALTAAYNAARYGDVPPTAEQLARLQTALDRLAPDAPGPPGTKGR